MNPYNIVKYAIIALQWHQARHDSGLLQEILRNLIKENKQNENQD